MVANRDWLVVNRDSPTDYSMQNTIYESLGLLMGDEYMKQFA